MDSETIRIDYRLGHGDYGVRSSRLPGQEGWVVIDSGTLSLHVSDPVGLIEALTDALPAEATA